MKRATQRLGRITARLVSNLHLAASAARRRPPVGANPLYLQVKEDIRQSYLLTLCNSFARGGVDVVLVVNPLVRPRPFVRYRFSALARVPRLSFALKLPSDVRGASLASDGPETSSRDLPWRRVYVLNFDVSRRFDVPEPRYLFPYTLPANIFFQYRHHLRIPEFRKCRRRMRVFFCGNNDEGYAANPVCRNTGMMHRGGVCAVLAKHSASRPVGTREQLHAVCDAPGPVLALVDSRSLRINQQDWLPTLAMSDFFVCAPGVSMPMCHSAIEAMAVGAIPIINYPHWFEPALANGVNALSFATPAELRAALDTALEMDVNEVEAMRSRALAYYDQYVDPIGFFAELEKTGLSRVTLTVNAEQARYLQGVRW